MRETVRVSLLHPQGYRASKAEPFTMYRPGIVEMPLEHAQGMGLTHRIVKEQPFSAGETPVERVPFGGVFDERLAAILQGAGYSDLEQLAQANADALRAIEGIGPANYTKIQQALGRA